MKYFTNEEITCKCNCGSNWMSDELKLKLDELREEAGIPITLTSACRCRDHNSNEGGKDDSAHISEEYNPCEAVDIETIYSRNRYKILNTAIRIGFHRIGIAKTFIHLDIDKTKDEEVVWLY